MNTIQQLINELAKAQREAAQILANRDNEYRFAEAQGYLQATVERAELLLRKYQQKHPEAPKACGEYVQITVNVPASHLEIRGQVGKSYDTEEFWGMPVRRETGDSEVEEAWLLDGILPEGWEDVEIDLGQQALLDQLIEQQSGEAA